MQQNIKDIEDALASIILEPSYPEINAEYERLLSIMGNVDGNEIISLVLLAAWNSGRMIFI